MKVDNHFICQNKVCMSESDQAKFNVWDLKLTKTHRITFMFCCQNLENLKYILWKKSCELHIWSMVSIFQHIKEIQSSVNLISTLFFQMVLFKNQKEEVTQLQAHFKKNQKIREYSSHISKVHSVDWSSDGSKFQ